MQVRRVFVDSLVFLYWHFLRRQSLALCGRLALAHSSALLWKARHAWADRWRQVRKRGDLGEDESAGDREHCVFYEAVCRGRGKGRGKRERCLRGIPKVPRLAPQTSCWQKAELPEHSKTVQQENGSLGVKYNSPVQLWNISPGEKEGVWDWGGENIMPLLLWKPNPPHHREEMCQKPGQPGCCSQHTLSPCLCSLLRP